LREHIPSAAAEKKMSKVDTLRHAVDYIRQLQTLLREKSEEISYNSPGQQPPYTPSYTPSGGNQAFQYESGYETSSYYSSEQSSPSCLTSPGFQSLYQNQPSQSAVRESSFSQEQEEEELLDVIAKWQDQD